MSILSNIAEFSAGLPLLPACNFSAAMATTYSTYRLAVVASLKFLALKIRLPSYWPMSNTAKRLDESGYHLVRR